jgi:peptidoglycan/xylan/chitin deacetylase (PgdA/CDA1 family)
MKARRSADSVDTVETHNVRPRLRIFRFPYGACNPEALQILADLGVPAIQWSIVSGDPDIHQTANGITRTVLKQLRPGSIVIFHANGRGHGTSQALPVLVNRLRQLGYETVTVSELLGSGEIYSTSECYEMKPGDNLIYDKRTKHKQKRNR